MGRKKAPFYHIVIADSRSPRDGRFIERIGSYNPMTKPATIDIDRDKALGWLEKGAQPTDTVRAILRFKGVLYRKHLLRGVSKGVLTAADADQKHADWVDKKETRVAERFEKSRQDLLDFRAQVSGVAAPKAQPKAAVVEAPVEIVTDEVEAESVAPAATEAIAESAVTPDVSAESEEEVAPEVGEEEAEQKDVEG